MNRINNSAMKSLRLFSALIIMGLLWGATIPLTKIAVSTGHQPLGLIVWQFLVSIIVLGGVVFIKRIRIIINRQTIIFFVIIALIGTIIPNSASYLAAAQLPAGVMAIIIASVPMFALPIALLLGLERFSLIRIIGVLMGITAIILLIGPDTSLPEPGKAVFVVIALIAPLNYGLEGNFVETQLAKKYDPIAVIFCASIIGFIIVIPLALATGTWVDITAPWGKAEIALICSALIHAFVYVAYIWMVNVSGAVFACQVAYIVTIAGVFYSALFLSESYSGWVWLSLVLMMCGLVLVQPRDTQVKKMASAVKPD